MIFQLRVPLHSICLIECAKAELLSPGCSTLHFTGGDLTEQWKHLIFTSCLVGFTCHNLFGFFFPCRFASSGVATQFISFSVKKSVCVWVCKKNYFFFLPRFIFPRIGVQVRSVVLCECLNIRWGKFGPVGLNHRKCVAQYCWHWNAVWSQAFRRDLPTVLPPSLSWFEEQPYDTYLHWLCLNRVDVGDQSAV